MCIVNISVASKVVKFQKNDYVLVKPSLIFSVIYFYIFMHGGNISKIKKKIRLTN